MVAKPNSLTANWLRDRHHRPRRMHPRRSSRARAGRTGYGKLPEGRGLGLACGAYMCGAGLSIYWNKLPHSGVQLLIDRSGQVTVFCGATEIGQGSDDVLAGIVAEVLGIDPYDVRCVTGDTGLTPIDLGSYSSRVTVMMGNAAIEAAGKLRAHARGRRRRGAADGAGADRAGAGPRVPRRRPGQEPVVQGSGRARRGQVRHAGRGRLVHAAEAAGALQGRRRRSVAGVLVHGVRGRSRRRQGDRLDPRAEDLDRARHRPRVESGAGARPGRRLACTWGSARR